MTDSILDQWKGELVKAEGVSDKIEESIQSVDTTIEAKLEVEASEPELREREVCKEASGFDDWDVF